MRTTTLEARDQQLTSWLNTVLPNVPKRLERLAGDASFRVYYRLHLTDKTLIAMDAPPTHEDSRPFIGVAKRFKQASITVPEIFDYNLEEGFLLISDFGDNLLGRIVHTDNAISLYKIAIDELIKLQRCSQDEGWSFPLFNEKLFSEELFRFEEWYLLRHLKYNLTAAEKGILHKSFKLLINNALTQPQLCVHRDYHSRNLLVLPDQKLGVIDFQDAVWGPITYDLVSLIRDCYVAWPDDYLAEWINYYYEQAINQKILQSVSRDQFKHWLDLMGIQRHLKAIHIFARKFERDGSTAYLGDIPRTLNYIVQVSRHYPELNDLRNFLTTLPQIEYRL